VQHPRRGGWPGKASSAFTKPELRWASVEHAVGQLSVVSVNGKVHLQAMAVATGRLSRWHWRTGWFGRSVGIGEQAGSVALLA